MLGPGTGSTIAFAIEALAARIGKGLRIVGIPTSDKTAVLARRLGVPLVGGQAQVVSEDMTPDRWAKPSRLRQPSLTIRSRWRGHDTVI